MRPSWSHWLDEISESWAAWMASMSYQIVLVLLVVSLLSWICRGRSARLRHALWLLVFVRLIVPPDLAFPTGVAWWLRNPLPAGVSSTAGGAAVFDPLLTRPLATATGVNTAESPSRGVSLATMLFLAWAGVLAARCGMFFTAWLQVRSWIMRSRALDEPRFSSCWRRARTRVAIQRDIDVRDSDACDTPLVMGVIKPTILLPSSLVARLDDEELESILVHELMHVRRGDGWIRMAQLLLQSVYFFHPAIWWAATIERQLREEACDEAALEACGGRRKPYASALVITATQAGYSAPAMALGLKNASRFMRHRIQRILDPSLPLSGPPMWRILSLQLVVAAMVFPSGARPGLSLRRDPTFADRGFEARSADVSTPKFESVVEDKEANASAGAATPPVAVGSWRDWLTQGTRRGDLSDVVTAVVAAGPVAEGEVRRMLSDGDEACRFAAYEILAQIGSADSLSILQESFLRRTGREQDAAKRALDAVWERTRAIPDTQATREHSRFID